MNTIGKTRKRCPKCKLIKLRTAFNKDKRNADGLAGWCRKCRSGYVGAGLRQKRIDIKKELFSLMGNKCNRCGFDDLRALQIDHVYSGGRHEQRSSLTFYKRVIESYKKKEGKYQLLCANCNWIKRFVKREGHFWDTQIQ